MFVVACPSHGCLCLRILFCIDIPRFPVRKPFPNWIKAQFLRALCRRDRSVCACRFWRSVCCFFMQKSFSRASGLQLAQIHTICPGPSMQTPHLFFETHLPLSCKVNWFAYTYCAWIQQTHQQRGTHVTSHLEMVNRWFSFFLFLKEHTLISSFLHPNNWKLGLGRGCPKTLSLGQKQLFLLLNLH